MILSIVLAITGYTCILWCRWLFTRLRAFEAGNWGVAPTNPRGRAAWEVISFVLGWAGFGLIVWAVVRLFI